MEKHPMNLEFGAILYLEPEQEGPSDGVQVSLIGIAPRRSLIVAPLEPQQSPIDVGTSYRAHSTSGGSTQSFQTKVLHSCCEPYNYFHIQYPSKAQTTSLRRSQRLDIDTPALVLSIQDGSHLVTVKMVDISMLGACLVSEEPLGKIGDHFSIDLQVSECHGEITFPFVIRHIAQYTNEEGRLIYHHGVEFASLDERAITFISRFIRDSVAKQRRQRPSLVLVK